ncbi:hypothetical protein JOM56_012454 [Amanita muscaria]
MSTTIDLYCRRSWPHLPSQNCFDREAIKDKKRPQFDHVAADTLVLWNVSIHFDSNLKRNLGNLELDGVQPLSPWLKLSSVFSNKLTDDRLDIVVKLPIDSRKRSLGEEDGRAAKRQEIEEPKSVIGPWLEEIHSKIWGHGDELLKKLVHNVRVTAAHYDELRQRLAEAGDSISDKDVLAIKLDILLNHRPNPNSPGNGQIPENVSEESGDEDPELENTPGNEDDFGSFLPATIEFLDLSSLGLTKEQSRLPLPLFIRPEYSDILAETNGQTLRKAISHMVIGQPGIDGVPFLYQTIDGFVFHVSEKVKTIKAWDSSKSIVAFVDADGAEIIPKRFLHYRCIMFEWKVKLWTPSELYVTGLFLHSSYLDLACLKESVLYFGSNPRRCFSASVSREMLDFMKTKVIEESYSTTLNTTLYSLLYGTISANSFSHEVFEIFPSKESRHTTRVQAVSQWALEQLLEQYQHSQADAAAAFYNMAAGVSFAGPLRGDMFQLQHPKTFNIRHLSTSELSEWTYPGPARRLAVLSQTFPTATLKKVVENKEPRHIVPLIPNSAAVDSILYDPDSVLTSFQITINVKHPVAVSGLKRIQQSLKRNAGLAGLRPSIHGRHWRLIFVVPEDLATDFPWQEFEGDTTTGEWAAKVDQYVLGLPVDEVFQIGTSLSIESGSGNRVYIDLLFRCKDLERDLAVAESHANHWRSLYENRSKHSTIHQHKSSMSMFHGQRPIVDLTNTSSADILREKKNFLQVLFPGTDTDIKLERSQYPLVRFWTRAEWTRGSRTSYLEDEDGTLVPDARIREIRQHIAQKIDQVKKIKPNLLAKNWTHSDMEFRQALYQNLRLTFSEFSLCDDDWKAKAMVSMWYSDHFRNNRLAERVKTKDCAATTEAKEEKGKRRQSVAEIAPPSKRPRSALPALKNPLRSSRTPSQALLTKEVSDMLSTSGVTGMARRRKGIQPKEDCQFLEDGAESLRERVADTTSTATEGLREEGQKRWDKISKKEIADEVYSIKSWLIYTLNATLRKKLVLKFGKAGTGKAGTGNGNGELSSKARCDQVHGCGNLIPYPDRRPCGYNKAQSFECNR